MTRGTDLAWLLAAFLAVAVAYEVIPWAIARLIERRLREYERRREAARHQWEIDP